MRIKSRKKGFLNFKNALICHPSMITHNSIIIVDFFRLFIIKFSIKQILDQNYWGFFSNYHQFWYNIYYLLTTWWTVFLITYYCIIHHLNWLSIGYISSIINVSLILIFNPFFLEFLENRPKFTKNYRKFVVTWSRSHDTIMTKFRISFQNINLCFISFQMIYRL